MSGEPPPEATEYVLGYRPEEQARLQGQAEELAADAIRLFDAMGISTGQRVLEIGCGPRGCLDLLSERVGSSGSVVGIELNSDAATLAREFVRERGLSNVEVLCGDARSTGLEAASFDCVTARLVLVNVPSPNQIISEAFALAKPGGTVAFHEIDWAAVICEPPSQEWNTLTDSILAINATNGNDYYIGRKLPNLLRAAGLEEIQAHPITHFHPIGDPRRTLMLTFADNFKDRFIAQGVLSESEFSAMRQGLAQRLEDESTLVYLGPYVQAWGRKPAR
jgi:SAM-dependent methyltransferase